MAWRWPLSQLDLAPRTYRKPYTRVTLCSHGNLKLPYHLSELSDYLRCYLSGGLTLETDIWVQCYNEITCFNYEYQLKQSRLDHLQGLFKQHSLTLWLCVFLFLFPSICPYFYISLFSEDGLLKILLFYSQFLFLNLHWVTLVHAEHSKLRIGHT